MASRSLPSGSANEPLGREVWIVSAVVVIGVIMSILDTTIVNVALETLSRELARAAEHDPVGRRRATCSRSPP